MLEQSRLLRRANIMGSRCRRWAGLWSLLLVLLAQGVHGRVVVFEAGTGEKYTSDPSYSGRSFVIIEQQRDGEAETQTVLTVESWQEPLASHDDGSIVMAMKTMLKPLNWLYQQLEAVEAMQRASYNTFLMRYYEASSAEAEDVYVDDISASDVAPEGRLHHLGCKRFAAAMDEYLQAAADEDAARLQATLGMVEAVGLAAELDDDFAWDKESQGFEEQQHENELKQMQEPVSVTSRAHDETLVQHLPNMVLDDGSTLVLMRADDFEPEQWDSMSEAILEAQEALEDYKEDKAVQDWVRRQRSHQHQQAQRHSLTPDLSLLRGQSDKPAHAHQTGKARHQHQHSQRQQGAHHSDHPGNEDPFQPLVDLESEFHLMRHQHPANNAKAAADAAEASQEKVDSKLPHPTYAVDTFGSADRETLDWMLPVLNLERDWPMLVLLSLAMAAMATAFVVSWMQLQAALRHKGHVRVPVMVSHNGRMVEAVVLVPEEELGAGDVSGSSKQFHLVCGSPCASDDGIVPSPAKR